MLETEHLRSNVKEGKKLSSSQHLSKRVRRKKE